MQAFAAHPGLIISTSLASHMDFVAQMPALQAAAEKNNPGLPWSTEGHAKDDSQGCATTLTAALDPSLETATGAYLEDCAVTKALEYAADEENAKKLWAYSEELVGQKFDF